ncbi:unnamed protein product [Ectocarpus sp. 8 AP-2014]
MMAVCLIIVMRGLPLRGRSSFPAGGGDILRARKHFFSRFLTNARLFADTRSCWWARSSHSNAGSVCLSVCLSLPLTDDASHQHNIHHTTFQYNCAYQGASRKDKPLCIGRYACSLRVVCVSPMLEVKWSRHRENSSD